jgi:hypothetical protein
MARNIDHELTSFMRHLHDMNSDPWGQFTFVEQARVQRWMDAVLPPEVEDDEQQTDKAVAK